MNPWQRWVRFIDRREPATVLAICRILVGTIVGAHLAHAVLTGSDQLVWADAAFGGLRTLKVPWLLEQLGGLTPDVIRRFTLASSIFAFAFAAGAFTRVSGLLALIGFRTLADLNTHSGGSYDELLKNELFILILSGCGSALSIDALWRPRATEVPAWPRYVLVFQLVLMYWSTGLQKVSAGWVPGGKADALWYIFQQPTWHRFDMRWAAPYYPLTQLATRATWIFAVGAPFLLRALWWRHTRTRPGWLRAQGNRLDARALFLVWGFLMHLGIEATMEVGAFSFGSLALYVCAWHPDELAALWRRIRGR